MNLDKRAIIKILIVIGTLICCFGITPVQLKNFSELDKKIKKVRADISTIQENVNKKPGVLNKINAVTNEIAELRSHLVSYRDISSLQAVIADKAKANSIDIIETGSAPATPHTKIGDIKYIRIPMNLTLRCGYHNLGRFIADIEQSDYCLKVDTISITGGKIPYEVSLKLVALATE